MKLSYPVMITPRLLAGVQVGNAFISIRENRWTPDGRMEWEYFIDSPEWEYSSSDLCSGVGGGPLQSGLSSLLSFLSACAESIQYSERSGREGENADLFPRNVGEWACQYSDELSMLSIELEETPDLITE